MSDRGELAAELAGRYVTGHAGAEKQDFAYWSGLPAALAADGWAGRRCAAAPIDSPRPLGTSEPLDVLPARLLGAFDEYLLGWRDRRSIVDTEYSRRILNGGIISAAMLWQGRIVGTWRVVSMRRSAMVSLDPFYPAPVQASWEELFAEESADVLRFLGVSGGDRDR